MTVYTQHTIPNNPDCIHIKDLEIYAKHGVYPEENALGQKFLVSTRLYMDLSHAGRMDELEKSVNYGEVSHIMKDYLTGNTFNLLESCAEKLAELLLKKYGSIDGDAMLEAVEIEIKKPWAPIGLPLDTVSVAISRGWHKVYVAMGSNMGDRKRYLDDAVKALGEDDSIHILKVADYLETKAYGVTDQEDFLNSVMEIKTLYSPEELLDVLHDVENAADRKRERRWGPRTLDLDILFYDDIIYSSDTLAIPHEDLHNRDFVLKPLSQIAPYHRHPVTGRTVSMMLRELDI